MSLSAFVYLYLLFLGATRCLRERDSPRERVQEHARSAASRVHRPFTYVCRRSLALARWRESEHGFFARSVPRRHGSLHGAVARVVFELTNPLAPWLPIDTANRSIKAPANRFLAAPPEAPLRSSPIPSPLRALRGAPRCGDSHRRRSYYGRQKNHPIC